MTLLPLRLPPPAPWRILGAAPPPEDLSRWSERGETIHEKVDLSDGSVAVVAPGALRWIGADGAERARHPFPRQPGAGPFDHTDAELYGELTPGVVLAQFTFTHDLGQDWWWSAVDLRAGTHALLPDVTDRGGPACIVGERIVLPGPGAPTPRIVRVDVPGLVRLWAVPGRDDIVHAADRHGHLLEIPLAAADPVPDCGALVGVDAAGDVVTWNRADGTVRAWPLDGGAPKTLPNINRNGFATVSGAWGVVTVDPRSPATPEAPLGPFPARVYDGGGALVQTIDALQCTCVDPTGRFVGGFRSRASDGWLVPVVRDLSTGEERSGAPIPHPRYKDLRVDADGRLDLGGQALLGPVAGLSLPAESGRVTARAEDRELRVEGEGGVLARWTSPVPLREAKVYGDVVACLDTRGAVALFRLGPEPLSPSGP